MKKKGRKPIFGGRTNIVIPRILARDLRKVQPNPNIPYWQVIDTLLRFWQINNNRPENKANYEKSRKILDLTKNFQMTLNEIEEEMV
jgi:hypothetical protein